ncbi:MULTISPECIES: ATP synthase F1 subunit delta [unclassified Tolypothrix]|uniref:ATP synthase F1 subunit delta n=1 Tax=unclassified Tolypothrix TaxID=2649714 RepID=UPI0005EAB9B8|nr:MULTISPECIES: ATP synthase F1 subunit delta [unclassified Tolypothrix]BAY88302.1 ATP synthase F1 subuint delta [Microchaete diplosiphon NIES-3275]EKF02348.1 ATP synthase F1, delta subunit [Tolypothrix sp. PCC 7601]MBE9082370.1 F0F1 ATP synthase subunit delta [Tolypothrix sp. LEGE 11397]UYD28996.1 F0F1 ATP synthase subunit delta [Tolypothrix sp. PCC 7712]UYD35090.1 F0F1 ATP synthase subunit delta [Tolypothrix sp. PCC 7601]
MKSNVETAEVAQPYAQALMSIAQSQNLTEEFGEDARALLNLLKNSAPLQNLIDNPFIQPEKKKAVITQILGDGANQYLRRFLQLLVDKRRIFFLEAILQQYLALLRQLNQTVLAEVTSAVPLTEAQQQAVKDKVLSITNARQVELEIKTDRDLIGGLIIKVGSQVIDASLRGQLRRLSLRLSSS